MELTQLITPKLDGPGIFGSGSIDSVTILNMLGLNRFRYAVGQMHASRVVYTARPRKKL